jgi:hypothetical protein
MIEVCETCGRVDELDRDWLCVACRIDGDPGDEQPEPREPTDRETYNRSWAGGGVEGGIPYTDTALSEHDWRL